MERSAPVREIRTETSIEAQPDEVWRVLADFQEYPSWNPFVRKISGTMALGERIEVVLAIADRKPTTVCPVVTSADPGTRFGWRGSMSMRGVFDGHHVFELAADGSGTRLVHREEFNGVVVPILMPFIRRATIEAFEGMNTALKARVETAVSS